MEWPSASAAGYWRDQFAGPLPNIDSLLNSARPPVQAYLRASETHSLGPALSHALTGFCRRQQIAPRVALLTAVGALLLRHTGQPDVLLGALLPGPHLLPLRVNLPARLPAAEALRRAAATEQAAAQHALPLDDLLAGLAIPDELDRAPLFQLLAAWLDDSLSAADLAQFEAHTARCDLLLLAEESGGAVQLTAGYDSLLFSPDTVRRLLAHLHKLLAGLVAAPETPLAALPLLTPAERRQILLDWNDTRADYPRAATVPQLFESQPPHAIAVEFGGESLTYAELNARANQLARYLRARGVGPETMAGVFIERSIEMVVGLLAVLKAGGAYVPLDPAYPAERLRLMLADTRPPVILTLAHLAGRLPDSASRVIRLDADWPAIAAESAANLPSLAAAENLAYVMYTSGSTGRPKGIAVNHRAIVRLVRGANYARLTAADVFLQLAPISFDAATLEIWGALLNGAKLVVAPPQPPSLAELARLIGQHRVTILWLTAGLFHQMVEAHTDSLAGIRQLLAGGDVLSVAHVQKMLGAMPDDGTLINGYGPTENTTFSCCYPMTDPAQVGATVPIGRPISNTRVYILNEALQPTPVGAPGELYLAGDGLARGYFNQPGLTAASFIPNPFARGERLYRTGDLARWRADGTVEFLGRADQQVKIRGYRIELGEIETALNEQPAVAAAVVQALPDAAGHKQLVAYVVPAAAAPLSLGQTPADLRRELRRALQARLPDYMLPAAFVFLDSLPLTPNGKIDRAALPAPAPARPELAEKFAPPRDELEETLAAIWREVLGLAQIGIHDDFFALGGHSLLATQVVARLAQQQRLDLPLAALFESPTIAALAGQIRRAGSAPAPAAAIPPRPESGPAPLSFGQERLWFLDQLEPGNPAYNIPLPVIRLIGLLDAAALERSLVALVERHASLRTVFPLAAGQPVQQVNPPGFELPAIDLTHVLPAARAAELERRAAAEARRPFDLARGPLFRPQLLRFAADDHALLLAMHHIITDGWSLGVFYRELAELYRAFAAGRPNPLPPLPIDAADFAAWQRAESAAGKFNGHLAYWRERLAGAPPVLPLPLDHPRPVDSGRHPTHRSAVRLSPQLTAALSELSQTNGATLFMTLLAAFFVLLFRHTRQSDLSLGTPVAARTRPELEGLFGFLVNTLVLRADLSGRPTFRELLRQVRQTTLDAFAHQELPFEKLVEAVQPERDVSLTPLFQVMFTLQTTAMPGLELPGLTAALSEVSPGAAKFDLELELAETPSGLAGWFDADARLFDAATIERLAGHWRTLLAAIVANPNAPITTLPLLTEPERQQLLVDFNRTGRDFALAAPFPQVFEAQVAATPEAIAVECDGARLTYAQLNGQANRLAHWLAAQGVGPETVVALLAERGIELLTLMLAVFKAGGAYLPLDPLHPPARHAQILRQSRAPLVLAAAEFEPVLAEALAAVPESARPRVAQIEPLLARSGPETNLPPRAAPDNLAYVIFTSGSTGAPKGAMVTHRGMLNHLWSKVTDLGLTAADVIAQNASQCFDISVWQFLAGLLVGGQTHIFKNEVAHDPPRLLAEVSRQRITIFQVVPSLLRAIIQATNAAAAPDLAALRWVVPTGEALTTELARQWLALYPAIPLLNAYGSTECSDDQCHHPLAAVPDDFHLPGIPIGKAMANVQMVILDGELNPVPLGVAGELYVGGVGVGRGYLHDPRRTAEVFVPNPFVKDEEGRRKAEEKQADFTLHPSSSILYKTGDLGRYLPDGSIEFLGRVDFMVKIRGFRIELGEIEAALAKHPNIAEAVVLARAQPAAPDDQYLAAYVVAKQPPAPAAAELRAFLKERLPDYMLPAALVALDEMPLTGNGKINRRALPEPEFNSDTPGSYRPPETPLQAALARLWAEVLGRAPVGLSDDFFALGGHSLLATQLNFHIREAFQIDLPLRELFKAPTVAEQAVVVERLRRGLTGGAAIDFEAEAALPADIRPRAPVGPPAELKSILLTGATGFLGAFVLADLLRQTSARLFCLVRAGGESAARQRLVDNLRRYQLWQPEFADRLQPVPGDLTQPCFGLSQSDYASLAGSVQAVLHNGAVVNFVYPYERLRPANVAGTLAVLRLAADFGLPLHYVSTVSVFDSRPYFDRRTIFEGDAPGHAAGLMYGYAQSKWVAERLVLAARARGLAAAVYRPGTVIGDTRSGIWNSGDYLGRFITGCIQLGAAPELDQTLSLTPVNFVSRALVHLLRQPESLGQTFHLVSPHEMHLRQLAALLAGHGYPLAWQPFADWRAALLEAGAANALYPLLPLFVERVSPDEPQTLIELLPQEPHYDSARLQAALAGSGIDCPPLDGELLGRYLAFFRGSGLLTPKNENSA